jgi:cellobiose phosphorylase
LIVESLLGIDLTVDRLRISPCLPTAWKGFKFRYRYRETTYDVTVTRTDAASREPIVRVDGKLQSGNAIPLVDDRATHVVEVWVGTTVP